ncbi:MAG: GNAT family N-acetyltransferase [Acidobacteria bacterium]|nr:GNAT family N-acetyltransferase [Acidobacteriota bacterium]
MEVVRCESPTEFLDTTTSYRERDPVRTNILGSVAISSAHGAHRYDDYLWWVVRDGTEVVGAALRTAPYGMQIGPMTSEAAAALAVDVSLHDDGFPWVFASHATITSFMEAYRSTGSPGSTRHSVWGRRDIVYEAGAIALPIVTGTSRIATLADLNLAFRWSVDFQAFIDGVAPRVDKRDRDALRSRITSGGLWFWCVDDVPVAMAGYASPVKFPSGTVTRIGPVYTPEEHRGNGYAAAITSVLTATLVGRGSRVMLYADAANPTSNGVYRRIGYHAIDEVVRLDFLASAHA